MVMAARPGVDVAPRSVTALNLVGLGESLVNSLARVPVRRSWEGDGPFLERLAAGITREVVRGFLGYTTALPIDEFRGIEALLDNVSRRLLTPVVTRHGVVCHHCKVGGVPAVRFRPGGSVSTGTILYLHGGGYIGTTPGMYIVFVAGLARATGCEIVVPDYRLAPEFPFPAGLNDANAVLEGLLDDGVAPNRVFVAGDSGGGGLVGSLLYARRASGDDLPAGALLFSPEVNLAFNLPSVRTNAGRDVLPWNLPSAAYLQGADPSSPAVSAVYQDVTGWPPTFVAYGGDEMFRDGIRLLVSNLRNARVPTVALEEPGMIHVFPILLPWASASRRIADALRDFVAARLRRLAR